jgi:putative metallohydrolase (TIGR04338 family)
MPVVKRFRMQRDNQRSKLYKAEKVLADKAFTYRLDTVRDMERLVKKVQTRATLVRRYGPELRKPIFVGDGRGKRNAGGDGQGIYMPRWSRTAYIVLHELAHTISIRKYGRSAIAPHGRHFCAVYLDLVRFILGKEAADALKASFRDRGVKYRRTAV